MVSPVRLCGQCGQIPCVVFTACVVWWPLGCVYTALTCSCCGPVPLMCYSVDRSSAGPHAAHKREGGPRPAAPDAKAGGATNVRAASRVALDDTEVCTGGGGLQQVGVHLPLESFSVSPLLMAHLVCLCPPWQPTNFILMDVAAPLASRSDYLQACVCVASSHHIPCVPAVRLCVARLASAFLALWPSCFACVRACCSALGLPYLAFPFRGWCRHRGFA